MGLIRGIGDYDDPAKREQMHLLGDSRIRYAPASPPARIRYASPPRTRIRKAPGTHGLVGDVVIDVQKTTGTKPPTAYEQFKRIMMAQKVPSVPNAVWVGLGIGAVVGVITVASLKK